MKSLLAILLLVGFTASTVCGQTTNNATGKKHHKKTGTNDTAAAAPAGQPAPDPAADQAKLIEQYQKLFVPTDPWRVMNEKTNYAKGADWVQFEGRVTAASADGLVLSGWYGEPLAYMMPAGSTNGMITGSFFLTGYPRGAAVGQLLSRNDRLVALKSGMKGDLVNLDYGTVWVPEVTEDQKNAAADAKAKTAAKVLAWQKEQAEKGDAYGEYRMGVRYLNGDGVDKDIEKARDLLSKSAAQGNTDASNEMAKLPSSN